MKEQLSIGFLLFLVLFLKPSSDLYAQKKEEEKKKVSDLYLRAPGTVPGTLPEMRKASYWVSKMPNSEVVVLSQNEIENRNLAYITKMGDRSSMDSLLKTKIEKQLKSRPGLLAQIPNLDSKTPNEIESMTKQMVNSTVDYLRSREFGNIMAIAYSEEELKEIENEISYDPTKVYLKPQKGLTTTQCRIHIIPPLKPEYIGLFTNGKAKWDLWNLDVLPIGTPVDILFTSKTGAFTFILSERGYGWVATEEIGNGLKSKFNESDNFIVCTGDRVPYYSDVNCTRVSGWLRMGDRLPIARKGSREVLVPTRNSKGNISIQKARLKPDADIHEGYMPYTQKNVAIQSFKLLDNLYDWTGSWYGRNHATNIRDIFRSFGFQLPADGTLMLAYSENPIKVSPEVGTDSQLQYINSNKSFMTIQVCENSHSQLYMGNYNGMPIGFDAHGYSYKDQDGNDLELKRWVVGTIEMPDYFLKQEISFVRLY